MTRSSHLTSPSYMEMRLDIDGREGAVFLRIPTYWDALENQWIFCLKMQGKLIMGNGKDSFELQNNCNIEIKKLFENKETHDEIMKMFKPEEYWERHTEIK